MCFRRDVGFIIIALGLGIFIAAFLPLWLVMIIEAIIIVLVGLIFVRRC